MAMTLISEQVLGSSAASVTFSSIPGTFKDLVLEVQAKRNPSGLGLAGIFARFNGDSGTNYSDTFVQGDGTSAASWRNSNITGASIGIVNDPSADSDNPVSISHIFSYANTATYKTVIARYGYSAWALRADVSLWRSTTAISSMVVYPSANNFASGSTFRLWGVA